jgi:hypothetical protein
VPAYALIALPSKEVSLLVAHFEQEPLRGLVLLSRLTEGQFRLRKCCLRRLKGIVYLFPEVAIDEQLLAERDNEVGQVPSEG